MEERKKDQNIPCIFSLINGSFVPINCTIRNIKIFLFSIVDNFQGVNLLTDFIGQLWQLYMLTLFAFSSSLFFFLNFGYSTDTIFSRVDRLIVFVLGLPFYFFKC